MYQEKIPQPMPTQEAPSAPPVPSSPTFTAPSATVPPTAQSVPPMPARFAPQPMYRAGSSYPPPAYRPFLVKEAAKKPIRKTANYLSFAAVTMTGFSNVLAILAGIFAGLACIGMGTALQSSFGGITEEMYYLLNCMVGAIGTPTMFWLFAKLKKYDFNRILRFEKVNFGVAVLCVLLGVGVCMLANVPTWWVSAILEETGMHDITEQLPVATSLFSRIIEFICIAILPPITEEFAFRGVVLSNMRPYGDGVAVVFSAMIFGLVHGNAVQIPFAFIAGLILGFVYVRTNNLLVPMAIHLINNGFSVVLDFVNTTYGEETALLVNNWFFYGTIGLGAVAAVLLFLFKRDYFSAKPNALSPEVRVLSAGERIGAAIANPGFWCMVGLAVLMSIVSMIGL